MHKDDLLAVGYAAFNIVSACGIVFANKAVFQTYGFKFVMTLTWIHTIFTWASMNLFASLGFFSKKSIPAVKLLPLALGYIGYVVLCNVSLNLNSVGFYQIMKIAIAPTVVVLELLLFRKLPSKLVLLSVAVVCLGVGLATVTDTVVVNNVQGLLAGLSATVVTAMYQIWVGSKQKELQANSTQLLQAYTPQAVVLMAVMIPMFEPVGYPNKEPGTILGYDYHVAAVTAIIVSSVLGIAVSLSTFLFIGATSSLTYNIVGHIKTVIILAGGCLLFDDEMSWKRFSGISVAMIGIIWYTQLQISASAAAKAVPVATISSSGEEKSRPAGP